MAERVITYHLGDRVWLKPSDIEPAMLGAVVGISLRRAGPGPEYDVKIDKGPYVDDVWRGWDHTHLTFADVPPSFERAELERWLAS